MKVLILILCVTGLAYAKDSVLVLYTQNNYTGDRLNITKKVEKLSDLATGLLENVVSRYVSGYWLVCNESNYRGHCYDIDACSADRFDEYHLYYGSVKYLGPKDPVVQSITFYPEDNHGGTELIITESAYMNISFVPHSLITTGFSDWTLFTGSFFDGDAYCYRSTSTCHHLSSLGGELSTIGSVIRGCNFHHEEHLFDLTK